MTSVRTIPLARWLAAIGLLLYVSARPAAVQAQSAAPLEADYFAALVDEAVATDGLVALAPLVDAAALTGWLLPGELDAAVERLAAADHPDLRAWAAWHQVAQAARTQSPTDASEARDAQGYLTRWRVLGPFANDGMAGFATPYAPELHGVRADETAPGKTAPVAWLEVAAPAGTPVLTLSDHLQPAYSAVGYAATDVTVARARTVTFDFVVRGAYRVWLDGLPLVEVPEDLGGRITRDRVSVALSAGTHQLLVKVAVNDGPMSLQVRVSDADGSAVPLPHTAARLAGLLAQSPTPSQDAIAVAMGNASAAGWPRPSHPSDRVRPLLADPQSPGDLLAHAAYVVHALQGDDPTEPWLPFAEAALRAAPSVHARVRLARVQREHWRAMALLEAALADAPSDPWVGWAWADAHRREMGLAPQEAADARLRELVQTWPDFLGPQLALASRLQSLNLYASWDARLGALVERFGDRRTLLDARARAAAELGRIDIAVQLHRQLYAQDPLALGSLRLLSQSAREAGDTLGAAALLADAEQRIGRGLPWLRIAADHAEANEQHADARELLGEVLAQCPGCTEDAERSGMLALRDDDLEGARRDLERALLHQPQNERLARLLESLLQETAPFWAPWRLDDAAILALQATLPTTTDLDTTVLVDQRLTRVLPNGLAVKWNQQAWQVHTRAGADQLRALRVTYTPDAERVDIRSVRILKADGTVREGFDAQDSGPGSGPSSIYFDVRGRTVYPSGLEPGDVLVWEYQTADIAYRNLFDDYFGDVFFVQGTQPRLLTRWAVWMPTHRPLYANHQEIPFGTWTETDDGDARRYLFEARDVPRVRPESGLPGLAEVAANLRASTYADWDDLARWYWNLVDEQLVVSPAIEAQVAALIDGVEDPREQIARIYAYVVRNTRYVGLEFGIHGYKPYRTSDCFNRRFGDCKDTASLIKVMLGVAGIESHLVLVRTRDLGRIGAFPPSMHVFNHAIAWVPAYDLYLDGTAGFSGAQELPTADQGATALHILDGQGGALVTIPVAEAEANTSQIQMDISLRGPSPTAAAALRFTGAFAPGMRRTFEADNQRNEQLARWLGSSIPGLTVTESLFPEIDNILQPVQIRAALAGGTWVQEQGDTRILHPLGSEARLVARYAATQEREGPFSLDHPFVLDETWAYQLPGNWEATEIPPAAAGSSPFGAWAVESTVVDGVLQTTMQVTIAPFEIAAADWAAWRQFLTDAERALNRRARFVQRTDGGAP